MINKYVMKNVAWKNKLLFVIDFTKTSFDEVLWYKIYYKFVKVITVSKSILWCKCVRLRRSDESHTQIHTTDTHTHRYTHTHTQIHALWNRQAELQDRQKQTYSFSPFLIFYHFPYRVLSIAYVCDLTTDKKTDSNLANEIIPPSWPLLEELKQRPLKVSMAA
jgi:hypothetical protein